MTKWYDLTGIDAEMLDGPGAVGLRSFVEAAQAEAAYRSAIAPRSASGVRQDAPIIPLSHEADLRRIFAAINAGRIRPTS